MDFARRMITSVTCAVGHTANQMDLKTFALLAVALLVATAPLDLSQMAFALVGAVAYGLFQAAQPVLTPKKAVEGKAKHFAKLDECNFDNDDLTKPPGVWQNQRSTPYYGENMPPVRKREPLPPRRNMQKDQHRPNDGRHTFKQTQPGNEVRQPSSQPVSAPTFSVQGWEAEVQEFLGQISPTPEGDRVVQELAALVRRTLRKVIPEVDVVGFASGDICRGTAFGVAVPEVDLVVNASPQVLMHRIQNRLPGDRQRLQNASMVDMRKLQKSAIRSCTDRLVTAAGFKFRRSAFRGSEPKVTLLVPSSLGIHTEAIPIDLSVNSTTPLCNAALLTECGQIDARAKSLILLVKRWAKDRGVCHAAKGHLSPYAWTLLSIFYLQVSVSDETGPMLPPLEGFALSSGLLTPADAVAATQKGEVHVNQLKASMQKAIAAGDVDEAERLKEAVEKAQAEMESGVAEQKQQRRSKPQWVPPGRGTGQQRHVAQIFKDFIHFYCKVFDWRNEAVSVRLGKRAPPELALPLHIILHEDGQKSEVGPSIEDPFDKRHNIGECTTAGSLERMRHELQRAEDILSSGDNASLSALLEPWVPPEGHAAKGGDDDQEDPL